MKKVLLVFSILLYIPSFSSAQEDTLQIPKIYKTWIKQVSGDKIKGVLYQTNDSGILIANTFSRKDLFLDNYQITGFNNNDLDKIHLRGLNNIGKGILWGTFGGLFVGAIIGFASGDDPPNVLFSMTAAEKALGLGIFGGVSGAVIGVALGSIRIRIPINGNLDNFNKNKELLKKYSFKP